MIHIPNRTGVEPVNGAVLRWREMAQLMHPHNKTTKGSHTHTHTHPRPAPRSDHPWYL